MFPQSASLSLSWASRTKQCLIDVFAFNEQLLRAITDCFGVTREAIQSTRRESSELLFTFPGGFLSISSCHLVVRVTSLSEFPSVGLTSTFVDQLSQVFGAPDERTTSNDLRFNDIVSSLVYVSVGSPDYDMYAYLSSALMDGQWFVNNVMPQSVNRTNVGRPLTISGFVFGSSDSNSSLVSSEALLLFSSTVDSDLFPAVLSSDGLYASVSPARTFGSEPGRVKSKVHSSSCSSVSFVEGSTLLGVPGDSFVRIATTSISETAGSSALQALLQKPQGNKPLELILIEVCAGGVESKTCDATDLLTLKTITLQGTGYKISLKHLRHLEAPTSPVTPDPLISSDVQASPARRVMSIKQQTLPRNSSKQALASLLNQIQKRPRAVATNPIMPEVQVVHMASSADSHAVPGLSPLYQGEADVLRRYINHFKPDRAVMLVNTQKVVEQWHRWKQNLPRAQPYYAVKCNGDLSILQMLASLGSNFDCASQGEIDVILKTMQLGPDRIVYSNPCKQEYGIRHAKQRKVKLTVFDNIDELVKLARIFPDADLLLRIATDDSGAQCPLSCKFGASSSQWVGLLDKAKSLGLHVRGIHFHVGSGCSQLGIFSKALKDARRVFDLGIERGFNMNILNLGGGFPGIVRDPTASIPKGSVTFEDLCSEIRPALDALFPESDGYHVMAEPGRFFAASSSALAVKIYSRRKPIDTEKGSGGNFLYYINDGVYGSFNNLIFDHADVVPRILIQPSPSCGTPPVESAIFGQTCDGFDCVKRRIPLPLLEVGDWLMFEEMGAYTICAASTFNGFELPTRLHVRILPNKALDGTACTSQCCTISDSLIGSKNLSIDAKPPIVSKTLSPCLAGFERYKQQQQQIWHQTVPYSQPPAVQRPPTISSPTTFPLQFATNRFSESAGLVDLLPSTDKVAEDVEVDLAFIMERTAQRPRVSFRPLSVRPLQSTAQQHTSYPRLGSGKVNARLVATLLRSAYLRHRPISPATEEQPLSLPELSLISDVVIEDSSELPLSIPAAC